MVTCRKMQIDPYLTPSTKFCTKQTKEIDRSPDTLERIEEKVGNVLNSLVQEIPLAMDSNNKGTKNKN